MYDINDIVQGAVRVGLVSNTPAARQQGVLWASRDPRSAVNTILAQGRRRQTEVRASMYSAPAPQSAAAPVPTAASSVKSTDKRPAPAKVNRNGAPQPTKPAVSSDSVRRNDDGKVNRPATAPAVTRAATPAPATPIPSDPAAAPTEYPSFWMRGRRHAGPAGAGIGHSAAAVTASAPTLSQRALQPRQHVSGVHAAGDTTRLIRAERERQAAQIVTAQAGRAGHHDPHSLIAAAGDNAKRLADARRAELDRMARERAGRATTSG